MSPFQLRVFAVSMKKKTRDKFSFWNVRHPEAAPSACRGQWDFPCSLLGGRGEREGTRSEPSLRPLLPPRSFSAPERGDTAGTEGCFPPAGLLSPSPIATIHCLSRAPPLRALGLFWLGLILCRFFFLLFSISSNFFFLLLFSSFSLLFPPPFFFFFFFLCSFCIFFLVLFAFLFFSPSQMPPRPPPSSTTSLTSPACPRQRR